MEQIVSDQQGAWSIQARLLPYFEKSDVFERIDFSLTWKHPSNAAIPTQRVPLYLCPSDPGDRVRTKDGRPYVYSNSYGFNLGRWFIYDPLTGKSGDGSFGVNQRTRPASFTGGFSHTLCVAEVKAFTPYFRNTRNPEPRMPSDPRVLFPYAHECNSNWAPNRTTTPATPYGVTSRAHHSGFTAAFTPNTSVGYEHAAR